MKLSGEGITEVIAYKPGTLVKIRYIRPKHVREDEGEGKDNVVIGKLPNRPIPKGIPEVGLLAHANILCLAFGAQRQNLFRESRVYTEAIKTPAFDYLN